MDPNHRKREEEGKKGFITLIISHGSILPKSFERRTLEPINFFWEVSIHTAYRT